MIVCNLRFIVLNNLRKSSMSGYSLMKQISEDSQGWKPSPGSIYPLLEELKSEGLISCRQDGRKKIYSLTDKGKDEIKSLDQKKEEIVDILIQKYKAFHPESSKKKDSDLALEMLEGMKTGDPSFKELFHDMMGMKKSLYMLHKSGKLKDNHKEVSRIINDAAKRLRSLS